MDLEPTLQKESGMALNDTFEVQVRGVVTQTQHIHTLHFRQVDPAATGATLAASWLAGCGTAYRALFQNTDSPLQLIRAAQVCGTLPLAAASELPQTAPNALGTRASASDHLPAYCAALVTERTPFAGRSRMGRFFIGGLLETDTTYNDMVASYITLLTAYCNALMAAFAFPGSFPWHLVVHSRKLADQIPPLNCQDSSTAVSALVPSLRPTTIRSRKFGHGQ